MKFTSVGTFNLKSWLKACRVKSARNPKNAGFPNEFSMRMIKICNSKNVGTKRGAFIIFFNTMISSNFDELFRFTGN